MVNHGDLWWCSIGLPTSRMVILQESPGFLIDPRGPWTTRKKSWSEPSAPLWAKRATAGTAAVGKPGWPDTRAQGDGRKMLEHRKFWWLGVYDVIVAWRLRCCWICWILLNAPDHNDRYLDDTPTFWFLYVSLTQVSRCNSTFQYILWPSSHVFLEDLPTVEFPGSSRVVGTTESWPGRRCARGLSLRGWNAKMPRQNDGFHQWGYP